jgi:hypothetical protein
MDPGTASGFSPESCADRIIAAAHRNQTEVNIVRFKENAALYLKRFAPGLFERLIRGRQI